MLCVSGNCKWCMFVLSNLHKHYIQRQKRPTKLHVNPCRYFDTFKKKSGLWTFISTLQMSGTYITHYRTVSVRLLISKNSVITLITAPTFKEARIIFYKSLIPTKMFPLFRRSTKTKLLCVCVWLKRLPVRQTPIKQ